MKIITNNVPRPLLSGFELTPKELQEFDYYEPEEALDGTFFRYKEQVYDLGEFMRFEHHPNSFNSNFFPDWHGYHADSFFSGILVRMAGEKGVIVGQYYS